MASPAPASASTETGATRPALLSPRSAEVCNAVARGRRAEMSFGAADARDELRLVLAGSQRSSGGYFRRNR
jgi:hypothetical protein